MWQALPPPVVWSHKSDLKSFKHRVLAIPVDLSIIVFVIRSQKSSKFHTLSSVLRLRWRRVSCAADVIIAKLLSISLKLFWSFVVLIHASLFLSTSFVSSSILSDQRNSLISYSHLFRYSHGWARFCFFVLESRFHSAAFLCQSCTGFLQFSSDQPRQLCFSSCFQSNLLFLLLFGCVDIFVIRIVYERSIAVLVTIRIWVVSFDNFFFWASLTFFHFFIGFSVLLLNSLLSFFHFCIIVVVCLLFDLSSCLYDEAEHLALRRLNQTLAMFLKRS